MTAFAGRSASGESLVEVVVATLLLAVGALALAGGLARGERARGRAVEEGVALAEAASWMEAWRASPWDPAARSGSETSARAGRLDWTVAAAEGCVQIAAVTATPAVGAPVTIESGRWGAASCGG